MSPVFIDKETVAALLPMRECIPLMAQAFRSLASGRCVQPLRPLMALPDKKGLLGMMPGYSADLGVMGIKVLSVFPENKISGHSSHQGVVILFETEHGVPVCIADADEITAIRTPACSAVATDLLARKDAATLSIFGSGLQAARHIESMMLVRKIKEITLWSRTEANAQQLAAEVSGKYSVEVVVVKTAEEAAHDKDIICTVTATLKPIIKAEWISPGTHINAVGSSSPKSRELDSQTILKSKLFTDRYESILNESGDFIIPKNEGLIDDQHIKGEIGELLLGKKAGRINDNEITVFKSLGLAIEDIFATNHIYRKLPK
jgi:alanine dehydrogenase